MDTFVVTTATHPQLHAAFEAISHDNGYGAGHETYTVPDVWVPHFAEAEAALAGLPGARIGDGEFGDFCIGDYTDMMAIAARSPELSRAHTLLSSFFEDWEIAPDAKEWRPATIEDVLRRMPKPKPTTTIKQVPGQPWALVVTKRKPKCPR